MKILWLVNVKMPEIYQIQGLENQTYMGGWLSGLVREITADEELSRIMICYPAQKEESGESGKITFHSFRPDDSGLLQRFQALLCDFAPDVIHIHGTEFSHSNTMAVAAEKNKMIHRVVCSIQGLVSVYAEHFFAGIPERVIKKKSLPEILHKSSLSALKQSYEERAKSEIALLQRVRNVVGRTSWDRACVKLINPKAQYFPCNEIMRQPFYSGKWDYNSCEKYSIFLSQGAKPIKGLHMAIKALGIVKKYYPEATAYVAGENIFASRHPFLRSAYAAYIGRLIRENGLSGKIIFTGPLSAPQMKERMLKSNAFVLPSSIENSPNSLGEAMLLGVPCIASNVGGIADMLTPNLEGYLYPFDEYYKLAYYLMEIFAAGEKISDMAAAASKRANITHSPSINSKNMMSIYKEIAKKELRHVDI